MLKSMIELLAEIARDDQGLTSTEYSTMGGAMAAGVFTMSDSLVTASSSSFDGVVDAVSGGS